MVSGLEGTTTVPYRDTGGVPTVCSGHTGPDVKMGENWTSTECKAVLQKDLASHANGMLSCVKVPLNINQYDAFSSFSYNVGDGAFCNSSLAKQLNLGNYTAACNGMYKWVYIDGKYSVGLYNRRKSEVTTCLTTPEK